LIAVKQMEDAKIKSSEKEKRRKAKSAGFSVSENKWLH